MATSTQSEMPAFVVVQQKIGFKGSEWAGLLQSSSHRASVVAAFHHDTATTLNISPRDIFDMSMQANLLLLRFRVRCSPAAAAAMKELLFHGTFAQMWEYYNKWKAGGGGRGSVDGLARRRSSVALGAHVVYFFGADWGGLLRAHGPLLLAAAKEAVYNMTYDLGLYTSPTDVTARLEPSTEGAMLVCALPERIDLHSTSTPSVAHASAADAPPLSSLWEARLSRCHFDELWRLYARRRSRRRSLTLRDDAEARRGGQDDEVSLMQTHHVVTFHGSHWADIAADAAHELPLRRAFASDVLHIVGLPALDPHVTLDPNRTTLRVSFDLAHPVHPGAAELNVKLRDHVFRATEQFYTTHAGYDDRRRTNEAVVPAEHGRCPSDESATALGSRQMSLASTYQMLDIAGLRGGAVVTTRHELHLVDEDGEAAAAEGGAECPAFKAHVMQEMDATLRRCITDDLAVTLQLPVNTFVKVEDCTPLSLNSWRVQLSIQHSAMLSAENIDDAIAHGAFYATRQCLLACRARSGGGGGEEEEEMWDGARVSLIATAVTRNDAVTGGGGSSTSVDPTLRASLQPRHARRLLTQHRIRINGPSWDVVLRYAEAELRTAFQADLHGSLAIAQGVLTSVRFSLGSLIADFRVEHCDRYSRKTIDALLRQCTYAYTWAVYMRYVPGTAATSDRADSAKPAGRHDSAQRVNSAAANEAGVDATVSPGDVTVDDEDDEAVHYRPSTTPPPVERAPSPAADMSGVGAAQRLGAASQEEQQPSTLREAKANDAAPLSHPGSSHAPHSRQGGRHAPQGRIEGSAGTQVYDSSTRVAASATESRTTENSGSMAGPHVLHDAAELLPLSDVATPLPQRSQGDDSDTPAHKVAQVSDKGDVEPSTANTGMTGQHGDASTCGADGQAKAVASSSATWHRAAHEDTVEGGSGGSGRMNSKNEDGQTAKERSPLASCTRDGQGGDEKGEALNVTEGDDPQPRHGANLVPFHASDDVLAVHERAPDNETPLPMTVLREQPQQDVSAAGTATRHAASNTPEAEAAVGGLATTALQPIGFEGARWQRMTPSQVIAAQQTFLLEAARTLEVDPGQLMLSDYTFHEGLIFRFAIAHAPGVSEQAVRQMNAKLGTCRYERMWELYRNISSPSKPACRDTERRVSGQARNVDDETRHLRAYADNTSWHTHDHDQGSRDAAMTSAEGPADMNISSRSHGNETDTTVVRAAAEHVQRTHGTTPTRSAVKEGGMANVHLPPVKQTQLQTVNATTTQSMRMSVPHERRRVGESTMTMASAARSPKLSPPMSPAPSLSQSQTRLGSADAMSRRQVQQGRRSRSPQGRRQQRPEVRVERLEAVLPRYTMRNARYPNSTAITNTSSYNSRNTLQDPAPAQERSTRVILPPLQQSQQHMAMLRALLPSTRRVTPTRFDQYYKRFWPYLVPPDVMRMELEDEEEEEDE